MPATSDVWAYAVLFLDFSCEAGFYLDLATQTCQECAIGTYSLGSGMSFNVWDTLPEGFTSHSEAVTFAQYKTKVNNCSS